MKECYNCPCILSQDDVMEFAEELFENKSCTVLFNLKYWDYMLSLKWMKKI